MDLKLAEKTAVVVGAGKGLGKAVAEALAAEGVNLAICGRDENRLVEVEEALRQRFGIRVAARPCDVTKREEIEFFKRFVREQFGTCHILFTNAGGPPPGKVDTFNTDDFRQALELNLLSAIELINAFLPFMKEQKWGRILASSSITVKQPIPTLALSNVSRVGLVAYIKSLARETAHLNISANVLAPGYIMTERVQKLLEERSVKEHITYEQAMQNLLNSIPAGRIGDPREFGALCAFLASEQAAFITGETFLIDGGMYNGLM